MKPRFVYSVFLWNSCVKCSPLLNITVQATSYLVERREELKKFRQLVAAELEMGTCVGAGRTHLTPKIITN